jgi:hypothetical protein
MAAIPTAPTEIDRKLHRVILSTNSTLFTDMTALARSIEEGHHAEFSYSRAGRTEFSSAQTITKYVSYAKTVGLLDGNLAATKLKKDVRSLEEFQQWVSDIVVQYLIDNQCAIDQIRDAAVALLQEFPSKLPTPANVLRRLQSPLRFEVFRLSLRVVSQLRPDALEVRSRRIILIPKSVET